MTIRRITAFVAGVLSLIFGGMLAVVFSDPHMSIDPPAFQYVLFIFGILLILCGLLGIIGGVLLVSHDRAARLLLLLAAIAGAPSMMIFFVMMMRARGKSPHDQHDFSYLNDPDNGPTLPAGPAVAYVPPPTYRRIRHS